MVYKAAKVNSRLLKCFAMAYKGGYSKSRPFTPHAYTSYNGGVNDDFYHSRRLCLNIRRRLATFFALGHKTTR